MIKKRGPAGPSAPLRFLPAALWYALIFWFSSKTAAVSGGQSGGLSTGLLDLISPAFRSAGETLRPFAVELLSFPVRKCAHMFLYFVLSLLLLFALEGVRRGRPLALALCAALAALDEYHQTFVPGRSGEPRDVLVDLCGAAIALGLWALAVWGSRERPRRQAARRRRWVRPWPAAPGLLLLAAALASPLWAGPLEGLLAECFVDGFPPLDGAEKARLLAGAAPVLRDALTAVSCVLLGLWAFTVKWLSGEAARAVLGALAAGAVLAALLSGLAGAVPPLTAALLACGGWALAGGLLGGVALLAGRRGAPMRFL